MWIWLVWMAIIVATSSTVVHSREFVHGVVAKTPIRISEGGFQAFWDSWWWLFVKGYHVLEFLLLFVLTWRAFPKLWLVWVATLCVLFAMSDEWHQTFVSDRGGRWSDVCIDGIGIGIGLVFSWSSQRRRGRGRLGSC